MSDWSETRLSNISIKAVPVGIGYGPLWLLSIDFGDKKPAEMFQSYFDKDASVELLASVLHQAADWIKSGPVRSKESMKVIEHV